MIEPTSSPLDADTSHVRAAFILSFVLGLACSRPPDRALVTDTVQASAGIDSLNARLTRVYRDRDPHAYSALFTDSAVFEWPAFNTVRGRAGLEAMARSNWASLNDMNLRLIVSSRRFGSNQATEFGAFEQSWRDSANVRMTEFGRYVVALTTQGDNTWLIDRFFGFHDSTRALARSP